MKRASMADPRPIILIPSYNTGPELLCRTVASALDSGLPVMVVIDGSTDGSGAELESLSHPRLRLLQLPANEGKGGAVLHGSLTASDDGFTHVLTMDADGQHPAASIPSFVRLSHKHPEAMILGRPLFNHCAPKLRVRGRKISNFWANLETLGWGIDDSLFGMRLYPLAPLLEVFDETRFARRFDFDPEAAVRLAWRGVPIINLPTPVRYLRPDEGGVSQFRYLRDNALLTWMHLRLLFGFFARVPRLAFRGDNPLLHVNPST